MCERRRKHTANEEGPHRAAEQICCPKGSKVMEPAGGQPTPAISMLVVKSLLPLSFMFEEMVIVASCSMKQSFRNLKVILA